MPHSFTASLVSWKLLSDPTMYSSHASGQFSCLCAADIDRVHAATNMMIEAHSWVRSHLPYWDRSGGRDHIIVRAVH